MNESLGSTVRAAIVMAVSAVAFLAAGCGSDEIVVPKVTGYDSDAYEAFERLSDAGFKVEITDGFRTGPSCQCQIFEQWPAAGTRAKRGSAVEITVGGPGPTDSHGVRALPFSTNVPVRLGKLVGLRLDSVDRWLVSHHIGWSAELAALPATKGDDLLGAYVVTAQDPGAGDYAKIGDSVNLAAAPAKDILAQWRGSTVVVPHVSGDWSGLASAYDRLHARGLRVATNQRLLQGPYVRVLGQKPAAGKEVRRGTTVTLLLEPGLDRRAACCDSRRLSMPDFVGRNLGEVSDWLVRRRLHWRLDAPALPPTNTPRLLDPYVVTSQKPAPGTTIPESIPRGSGDDLEPIVLGAKLKRR